MSITSKSLKKDILTAYLDKENEVKQLHRKVTQIKKYEAGLKTQISDLLSDLKSQDAIIYDLRSDLSAARKSFKVESSKSFWKRIFS